MDLGTETVLLCKELSCGHRAPVVIRTKKLVEVNGGSLGITLVYQDSFAPTVMTKSVMTVISNLGILKNIP